MAITTDIDWPDDLACVLREGYDINHVSPLMRTELQSGRARQRRRFTSVPSIVDLQWMMTTPQARVFELWFKTTLNDGASWFNIYNLKTPIGSGPFVARFIPSDATAYRGPTYQATTGERWRYVAQIELWERPILPPEWADFPEWILHANIFDLAMNRDWPEYPGPAVGAEYLLPLS